MNFLLKSISLMNVALNLKKTSYRQVFSVFIWRQLDFMDVLHE